MPQSRELHHRRLWLRVVSRNSQPQPWSPHRRKRLAGIVCRRSSACSARTRARSRGWRAWRVHRAGVPVKLPAATALANARCNEEPSLLRCSPPGCSMRSARCWYSCSRRSYARNGHTPPVGGCGRGYRYPRHTDSWTLAAGAPGPPLRQEHVSARLLSRHSIRRLVAAVLTNAMVRPERGAAGGWAVMPRRRGPRAPGRC